MSRYNVSIVKQSKNAKTGPIPVSVTSEQTCPDACPFKAQEKGKASACYAKCGPLAIHWRKVSEGKHGMDWVEFCQVIAALPDGQLWRHNQAGDLPGIGDEIDEREMLQLVQANEGKRGFTYTHKPPTGLNRLLIEHANDEGFTVNLSGNDMAHADVLYDLGIGPVVTVLPSDQTENTVTPAGRTVVVCPAAIRDGISCATCKLCARANRKVIIGFPAHGAGKKYINAMLEG
jgi:hypothetical protein